LVWLLKPPGDGPAVDLGNKSMINHQQVKRLREKFAQTNNMSISALQAGVDRKTARKYVQSHQSPEQRQKPHTWRTRPDPLEKIWPEAGAMLHAAPELEARALFEHFLARPASGLAETHLRTFQRRVQHWRATEGPEKEVFFAQERKPGELLQLDWTYAQELKVTIQGELLDHLFCHCVLPYSNWQWATRCLSESFLSLVHGLQAALQRLGRCPAVLGTDNTSAATHELLDVPGRPRGYNAEYLEVCTHYDLTPMTINVGCPNEQGDVEAQNGHLKRRLNQHLLLRGSRDFGSTLAYDQFVERALASANARRQGRVEEELARMRPLPATALVEYRECEPLVSSHSLIRVNKHSYSVPSRLIGQRVRVQRHEAELKVFLGREFVLTLPRLRGDRGARIDFRHVIGSLLRKPGAFVNYKHREQLYPTLAFRAAYDRLVADHGERPGVIEYLQLLKLAAEETVEKVEARLQDRLDGPKKWRAAEVREDLAPAPKKVIELSSLTPSLSAYDSLLKAEVAHVG
jgi:hypothetical protein